MVQVIEILTVIYIYYIYILRSGHHNIVHRYIHILSDVYIFGVDPFFNVYWIFKTTVIAYSLLNQVFLNKYNIRLTNLNTFGLLEL